MLDIRCITVTSGGCASNNKLSSLAKTRNIVPDSQALRQVGPSMVLHGVTFAFDLCFVLGLVLSTSDSPHVSSQVICVFCKQHICHRWHRSRWSAIEIWREQLQLMTNRQTDAEWVMRLRVCVWSRNSEYVRKDEHTTKLRLIIIFRYNQEGE